ncbi:hypothetical protein ACVF4D_001684 [Campylobacter coli]
MEEKNKYNQCLLLNGYEFLDFENTKNTTLKEWLKDENFLLFIKSIPKDYIFIIKKYGIANGIFLTHKKTFEFAQKILEKVKDINFDFSYSEFEFNQNIFYALNFENKEISFTELVFSFKINSLDRESFDISNIYNKKHFIIQKDNSLITFKYKKIQSKGFNLVFLLENNILKNYYFNYLEKINPYIAKDFKNIKENHSFEIYKLLRIDFNVLINCHSVQEVIEKSLNTKINFNLNKFDIHLALSFAISLNFIAKNEQNKLYKFVLENNKLIYDYIDFINNNFANEHFIEIKYKRKKYKIINIASFLLYHKLKPQKESYQNEFLEIYILINDYIKLSYETNNLINLNINSINRITNEHNVLTIELEKKQIPKNKKLKIKEDFINLKLPEEFKLIETHKELYLHGMEQKNCVYTRSFGVINIKRILNDSNENKTELETLFATANIIFVSISSIFLLMLIAFFTFQNEINIKFFSDQGLVLKNDKKISIYLKGKEIKSFDENKYGFVMAVYGDKHIEVVLQNKENDTFFELRCNEEGCKEILKEDK